MNTQFSVGLQGEKERVQRILGEEVEEVGVIMVEVEVGHFNVLLAILEVAEVATLVIS